MNAAREMGGHSNKTVLASTNESSARRRSLRSAPRDLPRASASSLRRTPRRRRCRARPRGDRRRRSTDNRARPRRQPRLVQQPFDGACAATARQPQPFAAAPRHAPRHPRCARNPTPSPRVAVVRQARWRLIPSVHVRVRTCAASAHEVQCATVAPHGESGATRRRGNDRPRRSPDARFPFIHARARRRSPRARATAAAAVRPPDPRALDQAVGHRTAGVELASSARCSTCASSPIAAPLLQAVRRRASAAAMPAARHAVDSCAQTAGLHCCRRRSSRCRCVTRPHREIGARHASKGRTRWPRPSRRRIRHAASAALPPPRSRRHNIVSA